MAAPSCSVCDEAADLLLPNDEPLCFLHYYASDNASDHPNPTLLSEDLSNISTLLAEAFVQLHHELPAYAVAHPLDLLVAQSSKKKKGVKKKQSDTAGFVRPTRIPQRLLEQQQKMLRQEHERLTQTTRKRPRPSATIWNQVMEEDASTQTNDSRQQMTTSTQTFSFLQDSTPPCPSCESPNVQILSSTTARDTTKGEIWGTKDRDDDTTQYQCLKCGKQWFAN